MGKQLAEYKSKIIALAVELAKKDGVNIYYSSESLATKLRGKLEITGNPDKDLSNSLELIKEMVKDLNRSYI